MLSGLGLGSCLPRLPTEAQGAVIWLVRGKDQWWAEGGYEDVGSPGPPVHVGSTRLGLWLDLGGEEGGGEGGVQKRTGYICTFGLQGSMLVEAARWVLRRGPFACAVLRTVYHR